MTKESSVSERLLAEVVNRQVSEKFNEILRNIGDLVKKSGSWNDEDKKVAKLMVLNQIKEASGDFYEKMKKRIEQGEDKG